MRRLTLDVPTELGNSESAKRRSHESRGVARTDGSGTKPKMVRWVETWSL